MKDLKKLRQKRIDAANAARTKNATFNALGAKANRTDDENTTLDALDAELNALAAEIEALDADIAAEEARARRASLFSAPSPGALIVPAGAAGRTREPNPETTFGFRSIADFANAVRMSGQGVLDERLSAATPATFNQNNGTGGEGFLVPPDFSREIWSIVFTPDDFLSMVSPEPTASNAVFKPKDESTPWGSSGVQAYWRNEAAGMTPSKFSVSGELMTLHELYAFTAATNEVLTDAPMLQNRLTVQAGRALRWKASDAVMWGNGAGQPLGFMNSKAMIKVAKDAGQAAASITTSNLGNMLARILRYGGSPIWTANQDIIPQLMQLQIGNYPAFLPINQPLAGSPFTHTLLGYPIMFTEHAQTLGTTGDLVLVNLDGYYAATKAEGGIDFAQSMHLYFDTNMTAFRWTFRLAGQPILSAPVAPQNGANTKSHFISLATRA